MPNNDFALFIDELRDSRNISRNNFVEGIISPRQYHRFIKGESTLTTQVINQLLEKAELFSAQVYHDYLKNKNTIYRELDTIYKFLYSNNISQAYNLMLDFDAERIESSYNKKYYNIIKNILGISQGKVSQDVGMNSILKLIDYPGILEKDNFSFIEASAIMYVSSYLIKNNDYRIAHFSYDQIKNKSESKKLSSEFSYTFYIQAAKSLGRIEEYMKAYNVTKSGIDDYIESNPLNALELLFYLKALSERDLFKDSRYRKSLSKLFALLYVDNNENRYKEYKRLVMEKFRVHDSELIDFKQKEKS